MIAELGYRPSQQARFLVQRRTGIVGLILEVRAYTDIMVLHFLSAVGERLAESGYGLLLLSNVLNTSAEALRNMVEGEKVDGLIIMDVTRQDQRVDWLETIGFPHVTYSTTDTPRTRYVDLDYAEAGRLVATRLLERNHSHVALLEGPADFNFSYMREQGFRLEAERCGLRLDPCLRGDFSEKSGWNAGDQIAAMKERPTALFAVTDMMAGGAIRSLTAKGIRVPEEIEVIGFGNSPFSAGIVPSLTTVHLGNHELGRAAAAGVIAQIEGKEFTGPYIAKPHLVIRASG